MRRVADHGLIEIADLDGDRALGTRDRPDVAGVAVAADPDRWAGGHRLASAPLEPVVEVLRVAPHVGVRGASHLQLPPLLEGCGPFRRRGKRDVLGCHGVALWG